MRSIFISVLLLLQPGLSAAAEKLKCGAGELRTRDLGKVHVLQSRFCTDKQGTSLVSEPFNKEKARGKIIPSSEDANPGWLFCDALGGAPEFVEIRIGQKWFELDRCVFTDGTYMDTGSLLDLGVL